MKITNAMARTAKTPKMDPVQIKARRFRFVIVPPGFAEYFSRICEGQNTYHPVAKEKDYRKWHKQYRTFWPRSLRDKYVLMS